MEVGRQEEEIKINLCGVLLLCRVRTDSEDGIVKAAWQRKAELLCGLLQAGRVCLSHPRGSDGFSYEYMKLVFHQTEIAFTLIKAI